MRRARAGRISRTLLACVLLAAAGAAPAAADDPAAGFSGAMLDPSRAPGERVRVAGELAGRRQLTREEVTWLLSDLVAAPGAEAELARALCLVMSAMLEGDLMTALAALSANPATREAVRQLPDDLQERLLHLAYDQLLRGAPAVRSAAATVLLDLGFAAPAWRSLYDEWHLWNGRGILEHLALDVTGSPEPRVRAALARTFRRIQPEELQKVWEALRADKSPEVQAEVGQWLQAVRRVLRGRHPARPARVSGEGSWGVAVTASAPEPEARPAAAAVSGPVSATASQGGKKPEVAVLRARLEALRQLRGQEWFEIAFAVSRAFRLRFEEVLRRAAQTARQTMFERSLFAQPLALEVEAPVAGSPVYLNGVFAGRVPLAGLRVPPDTYLLTVREGERTASRSVTVWADGTQVTFREEEFRETPAAALPAPPLSEDLAMPSWWHPLDVREAVAAVPVPSGVVVLTVKERTPRLRLHARMTGTVLWETAIGLEPTSPLVRHGERLYWGAADDYLHAIDLRSGETSMVAPLGGTLELPPRPAGDLLLCAVRDGDAGGAVTAVDPAGERKLWSHPTSGRPRSILALGEAVVVATAGSGAGASLAGLDRDGGRKRWSRPIERGEGMVIAGDGGYLFLRDGKEGHPAAFLDPRTGAPLMTVETEAGAAVTDALISGDRAALATSDARLHWVDLASRSVRWSRRLSFRAGRGIRLLEAGPERISLIGGDVRPGGRRAVREGVLEVISPASGTTLYAAGLALADPPTPAGRGRVFLADADGEFLVRDTVRGWTPLRYRTTAPGSTRDDLLAVSGDGAAYLISRARGRLYAFELGAGGGAAGGQ